MFRNTVMFRWRKDTTPEQTTAMRQRTAHLVSVCPSIMALDFVDNIGTDPDNYDLAVVVDFDDEAGWVTYHESEAHLQAAAANASICQSDLTARIRHVYEGSPSRRGMVRHIAMYEWADGATSEDRRAIWEGHRRLANTCPAVQALHLAEGRKIREAQASDFDWVMEAHFAVLEDFVTFAAHSTHREL